MEPATGPDALSVTHSRPGHRPNFRRVRPARAERSLKDRRQRLCQASSFAWSRGPRCAPSMTKRSWVPSLTFSTSSWTSTRNVSRRRSTAVSSTRSEEHTSELQSLAYLVCRLLLEKKKNKKNEKRRKRRHGSHEPNGLTHGPHAIADSE